MRCYDEADAHERFADAIALVQALMPEVEISVLSQTEISFRCYGLEFTRARLSANPVIFAAPLKLFSVLGLPSAFWMEATARISSALFAASVKCAILKAPKKASGGGCIPSAGSSR